MGEAKRKREAGIGQSILDAQKKPWTNRWECKCGWKMPSATGVAPIVAMDPLTEEQTNFLLKLAVQYQCPRCRLVYAVPLMRQPPPPPGDSPAPPTDPTPAPETSPEPEDA